MKVNVTLSNRWAWIKKNNTTKTYRALREFWGFYPKGYRFMPSYKDGTWDGKIRYLKSNRIPAGLFRATRQEAEKKLGVEFQVSYNRPQCKLQLGIVVDDKKYQYQRTCADAMCAALPKGGGIILSATASGKTAIAAQFLSRVYETCLFVVDQIDLLYQTQKELTDWLEEAVGVVGDSQYELQRVTVGTRQTLYKHRRSPAFQRWYNRIGVVIVDELHEQMNHSNWKVIEQIKPVARYGLTATLQLSRKEVRVPAYAFAGPVIFRFPVAEGIERGVLSKGSVLQLSFPLEDPVTLHPDYQEEYRDEVTENELKIHACKELVSWLVDNDRSVIVLVNRVQHLKDVSDHIVIPHRLAYGAIDKMKRRIAVKKFERDQVKVIVANQVFKKGINIKRLDAIIDMAEMKSKNDALQKFGRGLRLHPDKSDLLYIDFSTQEGRFAAAGRSRMRAFTKSEIPVKSVKVYSVEGALKAATKYASQPVPQQMRLPI